MPELPWYRKAWAWLKGHWYVPLAVLIAVLAWIVARMASPDAVQSNQLGTSIDRQLARSRRETDAHVEAMRRETEERIIEVEERHDAALEAFTVAQAAEYAEVRKKGPKAVARWLNDFSREQGL